MVRSKKIDGREYSTQNDYFQRVNESAIKRKKEIETALRNAFSRFIEKRQVEVVIFSAMTVQELSKAISTFPLILKPVFAACNIGARAVERDLGLKGLDTYSPAISEKEAHMIAGYLKAFLPDYLELPTLVHVDRIEFVDKEIRMRKGGWERTIVGSLNKLSKYRFKKRTFLENGQTFEIDAASPLDGPFKLGIDIKRIEARRDIHKRCDEIVNKAAKLRKTYKSAKFAAIIYYPFVAEHVNVQNRLQSPNIDSIVFAGETKESIENAVRMLLAKLGASK